MKKFLIAILVCLSSCAALRGDVAYSGSAKSPFLEEQVRCHPVQRSMTGLYIGRECDLLISVTNPYDISIMVDFDTGLYEYRDEEIPPHTTRYFMGDASRVNPYAPRSRLLSFRPNPPYGLSDGKQ